MDTKVLLIDCTGYPYKWIDFEKAAYYIYKDVVAWVPTEVSYVLNGGVSAATGKPSQLKIPSILAIKGAKADRQRISERRRNSRALFKRDNYMCAYCGHYFHERDLTIDHVMPISRGGSSGWENLVSACSPCNNKKRDRTPEEAKMPLKYKPYMPSRAQYLNFQQPMKLDCQAEWINRFI